MLWIYYTNIIILHQLSDDSCMIQTKTITLGDAVAHLFNISSSQRLTYNNMFYVWSPKMFELYNP